LRRIGRGGNVYCVTHICAKDRSSNPSDADRPEDLRRLALAWLDGVGPAAPPPAWLEEALFALVPAMPPDVAPTMSSLAPYRWLRIASALDFVGAVDGARDVLDRLESEVPPQLPAPDAAEFLALVCARRGRLARQRGEIDAAVDWYQRGLARADGARHRDAWGACIQGLAACAQFRDDSVTAERFSRLVAMNHAVVPTYALVAALLTLAVMNRKRGRTEAALRYAWHAHDLVDERDERRGMALVELSHLALLRGQLGAAQRGFNVVLSFARTMRVRRPALSGLLRAALEAWRLADNRSETRNDVLHHVEALLVEAQNANEQWERLHARFDALEAYFFLGEQHQANRLIGELRIDVDVLQSRNESVGWAANRLLDVQRVDQLRDSLAAGTMARSDASASTAVSVALARLACLEPVIGMPTQTVNALVE
jgi:tetratricopeptide (TPR) repeat protein